MSVKNFDQFINEALAASDTDDLREIRKSIVQKLNELARRVDGIFVNDDLSYRWPKEFKRLTMVFNKLNDVADNAWRDAKKVMK